MGPGDTPVTKEGSSPILCGTKIPPFVQSRSRVKLGPVWKNYWEGGDMFPP